MSLLSRFKDFWFISCLCLIGIGAGGVFYALEKGMLPYVSKTENEKLQSDYMDLKNSNSALQIENEKNKGLVETMRDQISLLRDSIESKNKNSSSMATHTSSPISVHQETKGKNNTTIGVQNNH